MILEDALASKHTEEFLSPSLLRRIRNVRHTVKRYEFDEASSAHAGRFATECTDLVCENVEFALPPYPNTYVEFDNHATLANSSAQAVAEDTPSRLGFLFLEGGEVLVVAGDPGNATFMPIRYARHANGEIPDAAEAAASVRFMIGEVAPHLRDRVGEFAHRVTDIWGFAHTVELPEEISAMITRESVGEFKRAIAALLLLNQRAGVTHAERPAKRVIRSGKVRTYMAHSVVSIDLGRRDVRGFFQIGDRANPRRHQVEGHFVHYRIDESCGHEWKSLNGEEADRKDLERFGRVVLRWECSNCKGLRVRRESFERGDAGKGYVTKEYKVTSRN